MAKLFTISEPALLGSKNDRHPKEDWFAVSKKFPIYAVADGVTLEKNKLGHYPRSSGAQKVAQIFCDVAVKEAEKLYPKFKTSHLNRIFRTANRAVGRYNRKRHRNKKTINYWDLDLFAATASFALIKNNTLYWASICDAGIAHFDQRGRRTLLACQCWPNLQKNLPGNWNSFREKERKIRIRKDFRNALGPKGELKGYGVVTGEREAESYLNEGDLLIGAGDLIFLFSDGFEEYLKLEKFLHLFQKWPRDLTNKLKTLTARKAKQDAESYGQERTLIAISI